MRKSTLSAPLATELHCVSVQSTPGLVGEIPSWLQSADGLSFDMILAALRTQTVFRLKKLARDHEHQSACALTSGH